MDEGRFVTEKSATVYPEDALTGRDDLDVITPDVAPTLDAMFRERVQRSPDKIAYTEFDPAAQLWCDYTWSDIDAEVRRWCAAFRRQGLEKGDRVALQLQNGRHWVIFDQAALSLGLVVVPLYVADRPDNVNYVLHHSDVRLLLVESQQAWEELQQAGGELPHLERVVTLHEVDDDQRGLVASVTDWAGREGDDIEPDSAQPDELASIVYTSGTTGRPKGVMLSHWNMLANAYGGLRSVAITRQELMLSILPLSHTLERTVGYYVPMMAGAQVAYARSISDLAEDLTIIRPSGIVSVPRIFERALSQLKQGIADGPIWQRWLFDWAVAVGWARFEYQQQRRRRQWSLVWFPLLDALVGRKVRAQFGGRMTLAVVGGAPMPVSVARAFIALGVNVLQGYGLTESSPSISINTLKRNRPETIGLPLRGVEVRIGDRDELLARGPNVMMGYWKDVEATHQALDKDGWLHTGDQAGIDDGYLVITGRIKEILVLANGEKVPPADMESAIAEDPLFEQSLVIGEQMPFLTALVVLDRRLWREQAGELGVAGDDQSVLDSEPVQELLLERIQKQIYEFPGYARIRKATALLTPWTVENGLLTPTLKLRRAKILESLEKEIAAMYAGHAVYKQTASPSTEKRETP